MSKKILNKNRLKEILLSKTLLIILALVVILRIPSLFEPYWYGDEAIYLTVGNAMRQGAMLYKNIFDHKPPAIYVLAAISGSLFWFKFVLLVWHAITVVLFWKLSHILLKNNKAAIISVSLFALLTTIPLIEGNIVNSELLMAGPTIGAFVILLGSKRLTNQKIVFAGLLFSLAVFFKIPAILDFAALLSFWIIGVKTKKALTRISYRIGLIVAAFLAPIVASIIYYWIRGGLIEYISTTFFLNFTYISLWNPRLAEITTPILEQIKYINLPIRTILLLVISGLIFYTRKSFSKSSLFASIWLVFTLFAALLSARPYPHYLIQTMAPLTLLIAITICKRGRQKFIPIPFIALFAASLVFYKFYYYPTISYYQNFLSFIIGQKSQAEYFAYFNKKTLATYQAANYINQRTRYGARIFIWGTAPEIYALSRHIPPGRFITSFHIKDFHGEAETIRDLQKNKPSYVLVLQDEDREFPALFKFLSENYLKIKTENRIEYWKLVSPQLIKALRSYQ